MNKAVIIGQSHTACIAAAADTNPGWDHVSVFRLRSGDKQDDPTALAFGDAVELVRNLESGTSLFLSGPGTYHNIIGLVRPSVEFDVMLLPADPVFDRAQLIPHRVVAQSFDKHLGTEKLVPTMKAAAKGPVHLLSCPPPKQNNAFMLERMLKKSNKLYRGRDVAACGLNRPMLRRRLWGLECERMAAWAAAQDVGFVAAPQACFDEDGFLASQFYAPDATHANADYGLLVLELIASLSHQPKGAV